MPDPVNGLLAARMDPERRRRIGNALLAAQFDRETPQDAPVTERAGLFPLATYANGQTGPAWPGLIATPVEKMAQVLRGEITPGTPEFNEAGFDISGAAMVGGLAAARPRNSVGAFSSRLQNQIHEAQTAANPGVDPNKLAQAIRLSDGSFEIRSPKGEIEGMVANDGSLQIYTSSLDARKTDKGKGYGAALYRKAAEAARAYGLNLSSDITVSADARQMYDKVLPKNYKVDKAQTFTPSGRNFETTFLPGTYETQPPPLYQVTTMEPGRPVPPPLPSDLYANARPGAALGAGLSGASERQGIRAYHGSPHDFDRFDMSKIGTGEGAQAYGHGLYFAENEGVARRYRDDLSVQTINGAEPDGRNPLHVAAQYINGSGGNRAEAIAALEARAKTYHDWPEEKKISLDAIEAIKKDNNRWFGRSSIPTIDGGRMYEVNIKANPDEFLDWDKPLSQQSEKIANAFRSAGREDLLDTVNPYNVRDALERLGGQRLRPNQPAREMMNEASSALRDAGIPGIKYLDQGSRSAGEGSRNYVVFDANLIEILRKYGLLGMLGAGGMAQELMKPSKPNIPDDAA